MIRLTSTAIILAVGMTACIKKHTNQGSSTKTGPVALNPGEGYDSLKLRFTDQMCLKFTPDARDGVSEKQAFLERLENENDIIKSVGYQASGSFTYGLAKGDAKAALVEEGRSTERSVSFLSYMRVISKIVRAMSPQADGALNRTLCGDQYVSSVSYGSEITVLVKMNFAAEKYKNSFSAAVGGTYASLGDIKASLNTLDDETRKYTSIIIRYASTGESLTDVTKIFAGHDVINCSLTDFGACENALAAIVDYQNGKFIEHAAASQSVIAYELTPYPGTTFNIDTLIKARRDTLGQILTSEELNFQRAQSLAESVLLNSEERDAAKRTGQDISYNIAQIKDAIISCYDDPSSCDNSPKLRSYDTASLAHRVITKTATVSSEVTGVTNCSETIRGEVANNCKDQASKLPGDVEDIQVTLGSEDFENKDDIFNGRSCKIRVENSQCTIKLRI